MTTSDAGLMALLRRDWDVQAPLPDLSTLDWTEVVRTALHHGVAGLLCRALQRTSADAVPSDIVDAAAAFLERAADDGRSRVAATSEVLGTLNAAGLEALTFKGVALAVMAHGNPHLRPSRDVDVLVHRDDMGRAVHALATLGYRLADSFGPRVTTACFSTYGQDVLFAKDRIPVEPHWTFAPSTLALDLDLDGIWARSTTLDAGGHAMRSLSAEDTLLVACVHGTKERWWRLLWVADVAALLHRHPALDWTAIVQHARQSRTLRMLRLGLGLAQELFEARTPREIARSIEEDPQCRGLVEESKRNLLAASAGPDSPFHLSTYHWQSREHIGDRVRYVWRTVTTPQFIHYRMIRLPDFLAPLYVLVKIVHDYLMLPLWRLGRGRLWRRTELRGRGR